MHIKSMGPGTWSEALLTKAKMGESPDQWKVWVGGPNGKLSIDPYDCDKIVLCGGGIGCTPFLALATDLHYRNAVKGAKAPPPVVFIHVERELSTFENSYAPQLELFKESRVVTPKLFCTSLGKGELVEGGGATVCGLKVSGGRPDFAQLLEQSTSDEGTKVVREGQKQIIGVYGKWTLLRLPQPPSCFALSTYCYSDHRLLAAAHLHTSACGPRGMMHSVREAVQAASIPGFTFYLHEETYEL